MKKFIAVIHFEIDEEFKKILPAHRTYTNYLINKGFVESYAVSMESQTLWITFCAESKKEVNLHLLKSPMYHYWTITVEELVSYDGQLFRLPSLQLN